MSALGPVRAATAYVDRPGSHEAAATAVTQARGAYGDGPVDLALCFHHGRHDGDEVLAGLRSELGTSVPLVGGTAMGIVTGDELGYEGHQVGVALIGLGGHGEVVVSAATGLGVRGEATVGADLAAGFRARGNASGGLFLCYSSVRRGIAHPEGFSLNFATPLISGILAGLGSGAPLLAGAGLIDSHQPQHSHVFGPGGRDPDGAVAVGFAGGARLDSTVLHGCRPAGTYRTITRSEGPMVLEIDGRPALQVIDELVGGAMPRTEYPTRVILGVNHGDPFGTFREEDYQTRLCLALDEEREAMVMFEPDLSEGSRVQLMRASGDLDYVGERVEGLLEQLGDREPVLALYADCAGRSALGWGTEREEAEAVQAALGDVPLFGFYTGVEVAPLRGMARPLDWTGVLCVISV